MPFYSTLLCGLLCLAAGVPRVEFENGDEALRPQVVAALPGGTGAGQVELTLHLVTSDASGAEQLGPPVFARVQWLDGELRLTPRYPLSAGARYRAVLDVAGHSLIAADYQAAKVPLPPRAVVERIYPTADALPANTLKFYVHFSQPMSEGGAIFDRIELVDSRGQAIEGPWWQSELWSSDTRRLTLLVHPGRIKQGVNLREETGTVLEPGGQYTLRVTSDVRDAHGRPLSAAFEKQFRTLPEDHQQPQPDHWQLTPPRAGSTEPLTIVFDEPLDRWLLERYVRVLDSSSREVSGRVQVDRQEQRWSLTPSNPWRGDQYTIEVNPWLEDVAGNTPARVFDRDLQASSSGQPAAAPEPLLLHFHPQAERAAR